MKEKILFSKDEIDKNISILANKIDSYIDTIPKKEQDKVLFIGLLVGSIHFVSDLTRKLNHDFKLSFIKASSYLNNVQGELSFDLNGVDISKKHIILLDDICDTGITLNKIVEKILTLNPLSVKTCVLLNKTLDKKYHTPDFKVFDIDNIFVYGYGMDYNDYKRGLKDIWINE